MLLTTQDVAHLLGISTEAVKKRVQRGQLKAIRQGKGRPIMFDTMSVEEARRKAGMGSSVSRTLLEPPC